jgi:hypothetical protein
MAATGDLLDQAGFRFNLPIYCETGSPSVGTGHVNLHLSEPSMREREWRIKRFSHFRINVAKDLEGQNVVPPETVNVRCPDCTPDENVDLSIECDKLFRQPEAPDHFGNVASLNRPRSVIEQSTHRAVWFGLLFVIDNAAQRWNCAQHKLS